MRMKTQEEFVKEVKELVGNEYKVLEKYHGASNKIAFYHEKCNKKFTMRPHDFLRGQRCSHCNGKHKSNTKEFKNKVKKLYGNEYTVIGEYQNSRTKIKIKHNLCGNVYKTRPDNLLSGKGCKECGYKSMKDKQRKSHKEFMREFKKISTNNYEVLSKYKNGSTKVKFKHLKCGNIFMMNPYKFLNGQRCPECYGNKLKRHQTFIEEVKKLVDEEYEVLGKYKNNRTKIRFKHLECDSVFKMQPDKFLQGQRCPICRSSKGEKAVKEYLEKINVNFKEQYRINNCKHILTLPFDFAVFENNKLYCLIEFDGIQHFKPTFTKKAFKITQRNDKIKNKYCKENNIKLIRIRYNQISNVSKILSQKLEEVIA